jgi:Domain of unknown function (DUF4442)
LIRDEDFDRNRRRLLNPWTYRAQLWLQLPLAAFSGMRLVRLDSEACLVELPGGWRTRNPFRSTYFAAQAMAAEMSTGAPAMVLVASADGGVALLVREIRGSFSKKAVGTSLFSFADVAGMRAAVETAADGGEGTRFVAHAAGRLPDGTVVAEFDVTWSFKRRR